MSKEQPFDVFDLRHEPAMDTFVMQYFDPVDIPYSIRRRIVYQSDGPEVKTLRVRDLYAEIDRLRAALAAAEAENKRMREALAGIPDPAAFVGAARELATRCESVLVVMALAPSDLDGDQPDLELNNMEDAVEELRAADRSPQ